ncbi:MAG TPA: 3-oxoacyl-ACP reductase FabG [Microbacteriaceae bacterium]
MTKVAVVTGAARGIGFAIAQRLASDGHSIAIIDLNQQAISSAVDELQKQGHQAAGFAVDVSSEESVAQGFQEIRKSLGKVSVLVNNAGVLRDNSLRNMTVEDWDTVMQVHLRGGFLMSKHAQADMVEQGWGRIINLSSTSATGNRGQANYSAAKAGIQGLTKTLAIELGKFGVTVNSVAPGFIETDMTKATAERIGISFDDLKSAAAENSAVKRTGKPEDIANAVSFFASSESGFVTGQVLYVAGGPHV